MLMMFACYYPSMIKEQQVTCPYCGEAFTTLLDLSAGDYDTIEDCYVCCRPIEFRIQMLGNDEAMVETITDSDTF